MHLKEKEWYTVANSQFLFMALYAINAAFFIFVLDLVDAYQPLHIFGLAFATMLLTLVETAILRKVLNKRTTPNEAK